MLEEGDKDDWFGSPFIVRFAAIAAIALPLFVLIELIGKKPPLNLRLLFRRNFGFGAPEKHLWRWMCFDKEMKKCNGERPRNR